MGLKVFYLSLIKKSW